MIYTISLYSVFKFTFKLICFRNCFAQFLNHLQNHSVVVYFNCCVGGLPFGQTLKRTAQSKPIQCADHFLDNPPWWITLLHIFVHRVTNLLSMWHPLSCLIYFLAGNHITLAHIVSIVLELFWWFTPFPYCKCSLGRLVIVVFLSLVSYWLLGLKTIL